VSTIKRFHPQVKEVRFEFNFSEHPEKHKLEIWEMAGSVAADGDVLAKKLIQAWNSRGFHLYTFDSAEFSTIAGTTITYSKAVWEHAHSILNHHTRFARTGSFDKHIHSDPIQFDPKKTEESLEEKPPVLISRLYQPTDRARVYGLDDDISLFSGEMVDELKAKSLLAYYLPGEPPVDSGSPLPTIMSAFFDDRTGDVHLRTLKGEVKRRLVSGNYRRGRTMIENGLRLKLSLAVLQRTQFGPENFVLQPQFEWYQAKRLSCANDLTSLPSSEEQSK
jgi:hypothetical protein